MPVTIGGSGPITGVTSINTTVTDTELGYLDGVTSAIQSQINTAGGLVKITDTSFTSSTLVIVNSVFSSTYNHYLITLDGSCATTEADLFLQMRASGTTETSSNYAYYQLSKGANGTDYSQASTSAANWKFGRIGSNGNSPFFMYVFSPYLAARTAIMGQGVADGTTSVFCSSFGGRLATTTQYDGFALTPSVASTGNLRVYGIRN